MKGILRRVMAAMGRDLLVQYRARYVLTAILALGVWAAVLRFSPEASGYVLTPAFLFLNTFLVVFSLGLRQAVCERQDGILAALDLTPLRPHEFLAARCASLGLIAAIQNPLIVLAAGKPVASWTSLLAGICGESVILSLAAFLVMAYAPPGRVIIGRFVASFLLLGPPLMPFLGFQPGDWLIAHPLQGPLLLFQGAFFSLPGRKFSVAVTVTCVWTVILLPVCRMAFSRLREQKHDPVTRNHA